MLIISSAGVLLPLFDVGHTVARSQAAASDCQLILLRCYAVVKHKFRRRNGPSSFRVFSRFQQAIGKLPRRACIHNRDNGRDATGIKGAENHIPGGSIGGYQRALGIPPALTLGLDFTAISFVWHH